VLDPAGHRETAAVDRPKTGDDASDFFGGEPGVWIVMDDHLDPDEWICDVCNATILTRWGDEPMPVPMLGSNALCGDCRHAVEATEGPWPAAGCTCAACGVRFLIWADEIAAAYNLRATARHPRPDLN
jgi:hypothetical protein